MAPPAWAAEDAAGRAEPLLPPAALAKPLAPTAHPLAKTISQFLGCQQRLQDFQPTNLQRRDYLNVIAGQVKAMRGYQNAEDITSAHDDYHAYRLLASVDGSNWRLIVDKSSAKTCTPHDYIELPALVTTRHLRLENVHTPSKFAVRDLRVFGHGHGTPPAQVTGITIERHADDTRNVTVRWKPSTNADGYLVRFNDCCLQIQGGQTSQLTFHALTRGVKYRWRLDAFNDSGLTAGATVHDT